MLVMQHYDEDLLENPFFIQLQNQHSALFETATSSRWIVCVPRHSSCATETLERIDFEDHMLIPQKDSDVGFSTFTGKSLQITNGSIELGQDFQDIQKIAILFEETFYNAHDQSYRVLCVGGLLTRQGDGSTPSQSPKVSLPNSYEDCIELLWGHSAGKKTKDSLDKTIAVFSAAYESLEGESLSTILDVSTAQFTKAMQIVLKDTIQKTSAKFNSDYMECLKMAVEMYILHSIHKNLFRALTACLASQDAVLNKLTRNLVDIQLQDLGIKQHFRHNIPAAKKELSNLNRYSTPVGKLFCIRRVVSALTKPSRYNKETDVTMTTDDLLPILIFMVLKSEVANWLANLMYMKNFHFSKTSSFDEYGIQRLSIFPALEGDTPPRLAGFYLATMEAALEYIKTEQLKEILTKKDHWKNMQLEMTVNVSDPSSMIWARQNSSTSPIDVFFQHIRDGNEEMVRDMLDRRKRTTEDLFPKLCHPLCSCDNCEKLIAEMRGDSTLVSTYTRDDKGYTALHMAAICGHAKLIDILIHSGSVVDATDYLGSTPVLLACQRGYQSVLLLLIHFGADVTLADNDGNTPLHLAAANGHEDCVKALLFSDMSTHQPNINAGNDIGDAPLHLAAKWGFESIVEILVECGAQIDLKNRKKQTPYICAHNVKVQKRLQSTQDISSQLWSTKAITRGQSVHEKRGSLPSSSDLNGASLDRHTNASSSWYDISGINESHEEPNRKLDLLFKAVKNDDIELVKFYLEWTNNSDSEDEDNVDLSRMELCHPLCQCPKCSPMQKALAKTSNGIHVNCTDTDGCTLLHVAVLCGNYKMAELFLQRGAMVNAPSKLHRTPLHMACWKGRKQLAKLLLEKEAKPNAVDQSGNTALHYCAFHNYPQIAELLIEYGAKINPGNRKQNTALHEAVQGRQPDMVATLLKNGAKSDKVNRRGLKPMELTHEEDKIILKMFHCHNEEKKKRELENQLLLSSTKGVSSPTTPEENMKRFFAAFEDSDLEKLQTLTSAIRTFNSKERLKKTLTRDLSRPKFDQQLLKSLSIKHFDTSSLKHVDLVDKSDPMYILSIPQMDDTVLEATPGNSIEMSCDTIDETTTTLLTKHERLTDDSLCNQESDLDKGVRRLDKMIQPPEQLFQCNTETDYNSLQSAESHPASNITLCEDETPVSNIALGEDETLDSNTCITLCEHETPSSNITLCEDETPVSNITLGEDETTVSNITLGEDETPASNITLGEDETPSSNITLGEDETPVSNITLGEDETPVSNITLGEDETPASNITLGEDETPASNITLGEDETPSSNITLGEDETPVSNITLGEDETPVSNITLGEDETPASNITLVTVETPAIDIHSSGC